MSMSALTNSRKERVRGDSRETFDPNDSPKECGPGDSRERLARNNSAGKTVQEKTLDIRARCDALRRLSDNELLSGMETAHDEEQVSQLKVLLYLGEIERRRFYLAKGYGTLFEFCTDTYNYSRSTAWRRISAARCVRRFPRVGVMLLSGGLSLTVISMISGILTGENADEILSRIGGKSFRDVEMLIARYNPHAVIRDRIRPVYVMSPVPVCEPGGEATHSVEKTPGCSGGESASVERTPGSGSGESVTNSEDTSAFATAPAGGDTANSSLNVETKCTVNRTSDPDMGSEKSPSSEFNVTGTPGAGELERVMLEQRYKLEFSVNQEFMENLKRVISILSTKYPKRIGFEMLFDILMTEYLEHHGPENRIKKRKQSRENIKNKNSGKREISEKKKPGATRTRHIPQAVRDEVFARDGGRCVFISKNGRRCGSTWNLQIDHIIPYAKGGDNSPENLRLLCAKHNQLAAEKEYGTAHMEKFHRRE